MQQMRSAAYDLLLSFTCSKFTRTDVENCTHWCYHCIFGQLGLSGKDYHMLSNWVMYDTEAFSVDSLAQYSKLIPPYRNDNPIQMIPQKLLNALAHSLRSPLFWVWFAFCVIVYCTQRRKFLYLWSSLALILALLAYLMAIGRLVYRVESGFWLYAAVLSIPLFGRFTLNLPRKLVAGVISIIAIANIFIYATSGQIVRGPSSGTARTLAIKDTTDYERVFDTLGIKMSDGRRQPAWATR